MNKIDKINKININGKIYSLSEDNNEMNNEVLLMKREINENEYLLYSIVRSYGAGVFFGKIIEKNYTQNGLSVLIENSRRLWRWSGASCLSQLAMEGSNNHEECKFSMILNAIHEIGNVIEIIPVTKEAYENINNVPVWKK